jgi:hypothetical protein
MLTKAIAAAGLISMLIPLGAAQAAEACIWVRNINDYKPADDEKSMVLRDAPSKRYTITFMSRCVGLRFTETIAVKSVGGMFCLSPGDSISFSNGGIRQTCMIDKITPLAAEPAKPADAPAPAADGQQPGGY